MGKKIIRRPDFAGGGVTYEEKIKLNQHAQKWISRAFRTDPIEPNKIIPAIKSLYAAADLAEPIVVIVPSPKVMAIAGGIAAAFWGASQATELATRQATDHATLEATRLATGLATLQATDEETDKKTRQATIRETDQATWESTFQATREATDLVTDLVTDLATRQVTLEAAEYAADLATREAARQATRHATGLATQRATQRATQLATLQATDKATHRATYLATRQATRLATDQATLENQGTYVLDICNYFGVPYEHAKTEILNWYSYYQGGNFWAGWVCYLSAMRDVIGLQLKEHDKYKSWEDCAIDGGPRFMHKNFCMVCDFPEFIKIDEKNRPHCMDGPSHRWRDGWEIYNLWGVMIDKEMLYYSPEQILKVKNAGQRMVLMKRIGINKFIEKIGSKTIDKYKDYELILVPIENRKCEFLKMVNPSTSEIHIEGVPPKTKTVQEALAWRRGVTVYTNPIFTA